MVCISRALSLKLQSENVGTYVHHVYLQKSLYNIYLLVDFQNVYSRVQTAKKQSNQSM